MLGIAGMRVLAVVEVDGELEITVETRDPDRWCRRCGVRARSKGRRDTLVRDVAGFDRPARLRCAHCVFIHPDDMARLRPLNVVAEFSHTLLSPQYVDGISDLMSAYLSDATASRMLDIAGAHENDVVGVLGSDWVVMDNPNVFPSLEEVVVRSRAPGAAVGVAEAIKMLTYNGAYAMGIESHAGTIENGKSADMTVLDRNLFEIDPSEISGTLVLRTFFEGRTVYEA